MRGRQYRRTLHRRAAVGLTAAALVAAVHSDSTGQVAPTSTGASESSPVTALDDASDGSALAVTGGEGSAFTAPPPAAETEAAAAPQAAVAEASALASSGIPTTALEAYQRAAAGSPADCHITWHLIAAIGRVESNHGRFAGAVLRTDGRSTPPIIGIPLDGTRSALIRDTDGGRLDGDQVYDRAVGPTQFIPSTWKTYASDGDGDGTSDPLDIDDAAAATAKYLCAAGGDLSSVAGQTRAVFAYNHSASYVSTVLTLAATYAGTPPPVIATPSPEDLPAIPPANPAPPPAIDVPVPAAAGPEAVEQPPAATPSAPTPPPATTPPPVTTTPPPVTTPTPATTTPPPTTPTPPPATATPPPATTPPAATTPPPATPTPTSTPAPAPTPTATPVPTPAPEPTASATASTACGDASSPAPDVAATATEPPGC